MIKQLLIKRRKKKRNKQAEGNTDEDVSVDTDELEEIVFVVQKDGKVKKVIVKTGIQDINYIEIKAA